MPNLKYLDRFRNRCCNAICYNHIGTINNYVFRSRCCNAICYNHTDTIDYYVSTFIAELDLRMHREDFRRKHEYTCLSQDVWANYDEETVRLAELWRKNHEE